MPDGDISKAKTVISVHGGGWNDGIRNNSPWDGGWMRGNAKYLAQKGFIGIVISYRSLKVSDTLSVKDILEDCADAMRYIRKHLKFVNFDDVVYMGDSAGGYLVTMLGLSAEDEIRPAKVVALNPVLNDLDNKWKYAFNNCDIKSLTPKYAIGEKCAEFLFMHGTSDELVEIEYTEELNNLLISNGFKSDFVKIPEAQNAFVLYDYKYPDEYVSDIMERIIKFI